MNLQERKLLQQRHQLRCVLADMQLENKCMREQLT